MKTETFAFGTTKDNLAVKGFRILNSNSISISVINWGATLISVQTPNRSGTCEEITLGFDNFNDYESYSLFFGSTVGRVANRIKEGRFKIGNRVFNLERNDSGVNHLHGGKQGFNNRIWDLDVKTGHDEASLVCHYLSIDGESGYPGNLSTTVKYTLTEKNELIFDYRAETDQLCPVNLTNHTYWNLSGNRRDCVLGHIMQLFCDQYLPVDTSLIPTGEMKPVADTPWDFRKAKTIGAEIDLAGGYDHCYVINQKQPGIRQAALVFDPESGREMSVSTTTPGIQFYSGNFLGKLQDQGFKKHDGFCLETQGFPDAVNKKNFPSILLPPGEVYKQRTIHSFTIR